MPSTSFCFFFFFLPVSLVCVVIIIQCHLSYLVLISLLQHDKAMANTFHVFILNEIGTQQIDPVVGVSSRILAADTLDDIVSCPLLKMVRA